MVNEGNTLLHFYLADSKTADLGTRFVKIEAHTEQTVPATDLGDLSNAFLLCYNSDAEQQGHFTMELM